MIRCRPSLRRIDYAFLVHITRSIYSNTDYATRPVRLDAMHAIIIYTPTTQTDVDYGHPAEQALRAALTGAAGRLDS